MIYPLPEILLTVLCATMSGAEDFVDIEHWAEQKLGFLRGFLPVEVYAAVGRFVFVEGHRRREAARWPNVFQMNS